MFNPADFDALIVQLEERYAAKPELATTIDAINVIRRLAESFGLMADYPNNGYPFCPAPGCNRSQEPGLGYCAAHYRIEADDLPNIFEPAPVRLCQECGAAPAKSYSRLCEACYAIACEEIRAELAQKTDAKGEEL